MLNKFLENKTFLLNDLEVKYFLNDNIMISNFLELSILRVAWVYINNNWFMVNFEEY